MEISENFCEGDSEQLYRTAHAIKSMSANIGAERVRAISAKIEEAGKLGEILDDKSSVASLDKAFHEFVQEFESKYINS